MSDSLDFNVAVPLKHNFISYEVHSVSNSADPDQMPHFEASDLGLHCLPMSHKKDARLIWVNSIFLTTYQYKFENQAVFKVRRHHIYIRQLNRRITDVGYMIIL